MVLSKKASSSSKWDVGLRNTRGQWGRGSVKMNDLPPGCRKAADEQLSRSRVHRITSFIEPLRTLGGGTSLILGLRIHTLGYQLDNLSYVALWLFALTQFIYLAINWPIQLWFNCTMKHTSLKQLDPIHERYWRWCLKVIRLEINLKTSIDWSYVF